MKSPHKISFLFLCIGFIVSATYQYYRSTIHEIPIYDDFWIKEILIYAGMLGISAISLVNKNWASKFIIVFCLAACGIGFGFYLPVVYPQRTNNWIDTGESIVYLACLLLAGVFSYLGLRKRKA